LTYLVILEIKKARQNPLISRTFYQEYGLYFACGLHAQHTQRDKVFAWANRFCGQMFATTPMTQMKKMKMTLATIYRTYRRTSSDEEDFLGFEQ